MGWYFEVVIGGSAANLNVAVGNVADVDEGYTYLPNLGTLLFDNEHLCSRRMQWLDYYYSYYVHGCFHPLYCHYMRSCRRRRMSCRNSVSTWYCYYVVDYCWCY